MGVATEIKKRAFAIFEARREELLHENFEPQLKRLGLSVELIDLQDLDQLNLSLLKVNDAISHPESFGTLKIMISADAGLVLAKAPQEAHMEIGILPLLLERKSLILNRIRTLVGLTASPRGVWARGRAGIGLSFWRGRASGVRSPFSRKEIPNVTVAYADDRRHEAGGFIAGNASHLH